MLMRNHNTYINLQFSYGRLFFIENQAIKIIVTKSPQNLTELNTVILNIN